MPHPKSCRCGGRCSCEGHGHYDRCDCRYGCHGHSDSYNDLHGIDRGDLDDYDDRPEARQPLKGIIRDWGWRTEKR